MPSLSMGTDSTSSVRAKEPKVGQWKELAREFEDAYLSEDDFVES